MRWQKLPNGTIIKGATCAILGAFLVAGMALMVRLCSANISTGQILFIRALAGVVVLTFLARHEIKRLFRFDARYVWLRAAFGGLSVSCYYWNLHYTSAAVATVMTDLAPIFVILLGAFILETKTSALTWIGGILSFGAVAYLSAPKTGDVPFIAVVLGVGGAFAAACAYMSLKKATASYSIVTVVWAFSVALLIFAVFQMDTNVGSVDSKSIWLLIGAVVSSLLSQLLVTLSYRYLSASSASNLSLTATIWALGLEAVVQGQQVSMSDAIACAFVIAGVLMAKVA